MLFVNAVPVRNEADVLDAWARHHAQYCQKFVVIDDASTDETWEILQSLADEGPNGAEFELHRHEEWNFADRSIWNELMGYVDALDPPADWVSIMFPDCFWHTDPLPVLERAEEEEANILRCRLLDFYITLQEIAEGAACERPFGDPRERRRWFSWGYNATLAWRWRPGLRYSKKMTTGPVNFERHVRCSIRPVVLHYQFRSLYQAVNRAEERRRLREEQGYQGFGKYATNWIIDRDAVRMYRYDGEFDPRNPPGPANRREVRKWMSEHK